MSEYSVQIEGVSKSFKLPHEKQSSIKSLFTSLFNASRTYEQQKALKNISFEVNKGEFFGIVGRNGSGKSTLLKLLAGIYAPSQGTIHVNGRLTPFIELGVGFNHELTGRENVYLNGALLGFTRKQMEGMYKEIVDFAELERFMDQKLKNYSSGMQVRLAFSIAIRANSDILLIDEVLAVGDAAFQQKCFDYFEQLKEQKKTVVFVSHDMAAVRRFCNRAVYIRNGRLTQIGNPSEIADTYAQDNIESAAKAKTNHEPDGLSSLHKISIKTVRQTEESLTLQVKFGAEKTEELYVGIAVLKDGASIAEINTLNALKLIKEGKITYRLDTTHLNGGMYQVAVALFRAKNREIVAIGKTKAEFVVKQNDPTKGGALKLENNWDST